MLPHRSSSNLPSEVAFSSPDRAECAQSRFARDRIWRRGAVTLVEVMVSLTLLATIMLGFIGTFIQSRRVTEASVLQSATTSMIYGLIEQMKGLDYSTLLPSYEVDTFAPTSPVNLQATDTSALPLIRLAIPTIRLRVHQDLTLWLQVRHTLAGSAPKAPLTCPAPEVAAADAGASPGAIDNFTGNIPMSTVTGTASQNLNLNIWVWIDEIPDSSKDVSDVKRVTVVYTYSFRDGSTVKTVRDMEVFLRTRYDQ